MNAKQENKVSMFWAVDSVLDLNEDVWQPVPAFATAVGTFRSALAAIQPIAQVRGGTTKGATIDKQSKRNAMQSVTAEVAAALAAYASDTSNHELFAKVDLTDSDLVNTRDTEITAVCQSIHDEANAIVANLADYGVTAPTLTDLQTRINAYKGTVGRPASAKSNIQAAGVTLDGAIENVAKVLDEKLDKHAQRARASQYTFFESYMAARSVVDNRGGRKVKPNGDGNGGTPPNNN